MKFAKTSTLATFILRHCQLYREVTVVGVALQRAGERADSHCAEGGG